MYYNRKNMQRVARGKILLVGVVLVFSLAVGASFAFASLTFTGTAVSGDAAVNIDATSTISIGASSSTAITIGRSAITVTFPGSITISGTTTTLQNLVVSGACSGCGVGNFTAGGDLSGTPTSQTVIGLQGRSVSSTAPSANQVLTWNGSFWTPVGVSAVTAINGLSNSTTSLVAGSNITITTSSPNVITIAASGGGSSTITINTLATSTFQINGTANQITVATSSPNVITLSLPQSIGTGSTPTFANLISSGNVTTTNITISGLGSSGSPCLTISSTGVVATTTCSGGGGVNTSGSPSTGQVTFFSGASTITGASNFTFSTSTGALTVPAGGSIGSADAGNPNFLFNNSGATFSGSLAASSYTSSNGSGAGYIELGQGTAPSLNATTIQIAAPASVTNYQFILPASSATGFLRGTNASNVNTISFAAASGVGSCSNKAVTGLTDNAAPTCTTLTSAYMDSSIATTGGDISTSSQVIGIGHISTGTLGVASGGTGTSTLTVHGPLVGEGTSSIFAVSAGSSGQCFMSNGVSTDPSFQTCPSGGTSALSGISAATGPNSINNGDNAQTWNWQLTTASKSAFTFGENAASAAAGTPYLLNVQTLSGSTVNPLIVTASGTANGVKVDTTGKLSAIGTGNISATQLQGRAVSSTAPSDGQVLKYVSANSDWEPGTSTGGGSSTPGGSNTQLQYNNNGSFGGISGITSDGTNVTLGSTGTLDVSTGTFKNFPCLPQYSTTDTLTNSTTSEQFFATNCGVPAAMLTTNHKVLKVYVGTDITGTTNPTWTFKLKLCTVSGCGSGTVNTIYASVANALGSTVTNQSGGGQFIIQGTGSGNLESTVMAPPAFAGATAQFFSRNNQVTQVTGVPTSSIVYLSASMTFSSVTGANSTTLSQVITEWLD
jgi:hypothetical protein